MQPLQTSAAIETDLPLVEGQIVSGTLFNEPMRVESIRRNGTDSWVVGLSGVRTEKFRKATLTRKDIESLQVSRLIPTYGGDGRLLKVGIQAYSLGIAYEFDPYFGLSISRVDPLPHQLEAVYDYLLKLARVRFLLADDAGAGANANPARPEPRGYCEDRDRMTTPSPRESGEFRKK